MRRSSIWFASILIALGLLLSAASNGSAASALPTPRNEQQRHAAAQIDRTPNPTPSPPTTESAHRISIPAPQTDATQSQSEQWQTRLYHRIWPPLWRTFFPPIWSNWALVIVAGIAAFIALKTLYSINRQTKATFHAVRVNRLAAHAAKGGADAAKESADALVASESPYLDIIDISFSSVSLKRTPSPATRATIVSLAPNAPLALLVTLKNVGRTPAFDVSARVKLSFPSSGNKVRYLINRTELIIGPSQEKTIECTCNTPFEETEVEQIEDARIELHAFWQFSFRDFAERDLNLGFDSFYLPKQWSGARQFDFPGWPRTRGIRTRS